MSSTPDFSCAPDLLTERLRLRAHEAADFDACVALWSEPQVVRYTIGEPASPQRTWQRLLAYRGHWALLGFGYWAVEERVSGRFIGELGFADFRRDAYDAVRGLPELGWALAAHAHGRGYATEALRAVVAWGDRRFGSCATVCIVHRDNLRSLRVAQKLAFATVLQAPSDAQPDWILTRPPFN